MSLTVGSLFAGIGGIELGLERAGMEVVWQVEKDDYCRRVLAKHWPDVERFKDVREVGAENLEPVDLICGGFPCQDISSARAAQPGGSQGIKGKKSGLWSEMHRVLRELRPAYALVENVPDITLRGLDRVLAGFAEIGFDAEWQTVPASAVGAPHRRERVFVVGSIAGIRREAPILADPSGLPLEARQLEASRDGSSGLGHYRERGGADGIPRWALEAKARWSSEPDVDRMADGIPDRVDRMKALGNAVVPQVAEWIGRRIVEHAEAS